MNDSDGTGSINRPFLMKPDYQVMHTNHQTICTELLFFISFEIRVQFNHLNQSSLKYIEILAHTIYVYLYIEFILSLLYRKLKVYFNFEKKEERKIVKMHKLFHFIYISM